MTISAHLDELGHDITIPADAMPRYLLSRGWLRDGDSGGYVYRVAGFTMDRIEWAPTPYALAKALRKLAIGEARDVREVLADVLPEPAAPRGRTLRAVLAEAAAGWTEDEIESAINSVELRRAKRQPRG